jgi:hypothetical protein
VPPHAINDYIDSLNPQTADRDIPMVAELMRHFGHNLMGVYVKVVSAGEIAIGDRITGV